ncbi:MAG: copper chaperone PCu(A)C [Burkholderiales bacterium]
MFSLKFLRQSSTLLLALCLGALSPAWAQLVSVESAWVRATVPGQNATGGFMKLTSKQALRLVGIASPAAQVAEIHEMKMDGEVMRMRAVPGVDLPAGQTVELKPGGYHLMLQDLKAPLAPNSAVPLTLTFQDAKGQRSTLVVNARVGLQKP